MTEQNPNDRRVQSRLLAQPMLVKVILGPPIWIWSLLYGYAVPGFVVVVLMPYWMIAAYIRDRRFCRHMTRIGRIVEWRHVRSGLLANSDDALLVEVTEKGAAFGWYCPHSYCRHLPRYDEYLAHGPGLFTEWKVDDFVTLQKVATRCMHDASVLVSVCCETISADLRLPKNRIHAFYGSVYLAASRADADDRDHSTDS